MTPLKGGRSLMERSGKSMFMRLDARAGSNAFLASIVVICIVFLLAQQCFWFPSGGTLRLHFYSSTPPERLLQQQHHQIRHHLRAARNGSGAALEEPGTGVLSTVRHLRGYGIAAYSFIISSAYRTGASSFAIVGLASKPLHIFGKPTFRCEWRSLAPPGNPSSSWTQGKRLLPDWGFGRVYTAVIVHCNFAAGYATSSHDGGELILHAGGGGGDTSGGESVAIPALREAPGFEPPTRPRSPYKPYKYDYLYCGSSLYGRVDWRRLREWLAYHVMLFGPRSHFVLYDADGTLASSPELRRVVQPWVSLGRVTVHDFREQMAYDGYYYNQFMVVNDCLFRHKHDAEWTFFFDVDEYVYVPPPGTLKSVLHELGKNFTQIMFEQNLMSNNICLADPMSGTSRQWGFEKLAFKNVQKAYHQDRKYVIKAALADSAGVHLSEHIKGKGLYSRGKLEYYHYHQTISEHGDNCKVFIELPRKRKDVKVTIGGVPYVYDDSLRSKAKDVKRFELEQLRSFKRGPKQQRHGLREL